MALRGGYAERVLTGRSLIHPIPAPGAVIQAGGVRRGEPVGPDARLAAVAVLVALGALVKTLGALVSGSRALLVDALTCFASLAGLAAVLHYLRLGGRPPDEDHPYGHYRLRLGGVAASLSAYMFVAGASAASLAMSIGGYRVEAGEGAAYALLGALPYAAAILLARGLDPVLRVYAGFTASEILESLVSAGSALLGGIAGYVYDLAGAAAILGYLLREAVEAHRYLIEMVSDRAAPAALYSRLRHEAAMRGLHVLRARLRMIDEAHCSGDAEVAPSPGMPADVADLLADELAEEMRRHGCDVAIHIAYAEKARRRPGGVLAAPGR